MCVRMVIVLCGIAKNGGVTAGIRLNKVSVFSTADEQSTVSFIEKKTTLPVTTVLRFLSI